jgi:hypothetical protein
MSMLNVTKQEWFAAMALQGLLAGRGSEETYAALVQQAWKLAGLMMQEAAKAKDEASGSGPKSSPG